ncbi:hypothetical protein ECPA48_1117 [Escherichia coli PA48]|nr:hypothetical protein EC100869_1245 [Escherichia coli 10.0869]ELW04527.1 hypothetical protein ECPA48_1117 [Escherichia coli PA48]
MCIEMHRLLSETQTMLAGYYWVMEYTSNKGLHIHFIGYLDGQRHNKSEPPRVSWRVFYL